MCCCDALAAFTTIEAARKPPGLSLPIIGKLLGHTQAATTQRYAHLSADPVRQAADRISGEIAAAMSGKAKGKVTPIRW